MYDRAVLSFDSFYYVFTDLTDCDLTKVPEGIFMLTRSATVTAVDFSRNKLRRLSPLLAEKYPEVKVGSSKFCELRPKEIILPGGSGTHNVCV